MKPRLKSLGSLCQLQRSQTLKRPSETCAVVTTAEVSDFAGHKSHNCRGLRLCGTQEPQLQRKYTTSLRPLQLYAQLSEFRDLTVKVNSVVYPQTFLYPMKRLFMYRKRAPDERWGAGVETQKMYGERLGDGVEYHLMSPTPRHYVPFTMGRRAH